MKKILYATDFSERSRRSFPYALQAARLFDAELVLVHVYPIPDTYKFPYTLETLEFEKNEIAESRNKLQEIFDTHYASEYADVNIRYRVVRDSSAFRGIERAIDEEFPAVLMLAAKGDNISQEKLFGGIVHRLIKNTVIPVLTIPEDLSTPKFSKILFTTNLYDSELIAIKQLVEILGSTNPEITVVHVRTPEENEHAEDIQIYWNKVKRAVDYPNMKFQELLSNDIYNRLNDYIKNNDFDVLTMTNTQHGGLFYRLLRADLVRKIETQATIPVLSFNDEGLEIIKDRDISIRAFKDSIDKEMTEIRSKEENKILTAISRITRDIETNYPELYRTLEEEPITLPTDDHPNIDVAMMSDYLSSLEKKLKLYKENLAKRKEPFHTKVYKG